MTVTLLPAALRITAALGTLSLVPTSVLEPVTVTLARVCPGAILPAEMEYVLFVRAVPLYTLLDEPAVIDIARGVTVSTPGRMIKFG